MSTEPNTDADDIFGAGLDDAQPSVAQSAAAEDDDFAELIAGLSEGEQAVESPPADVAPAAEPDSAAQEIAPAPSVVPDEVMARAARLGIPPAELFRRDPAEVQGFVDQVERFQHIHQLQQQAAKAAAPPPAFDFAARVAHYKSRQYDEVVAQDMAEKDQREYQLGLKLQMLEQQLAMQAQQQANTQAAAAVNQWNSAVAAGLRAAAPSMASLADDPAALMAIQAQSQKLGQMYYTSGQPMPDAANLAQQAAFMVYGAELLGQPQQPYASTTPRPRSTSGQSTGGKAAAIAHIARVMNGSK